MNQTKIEWCDSTWNPVTGCLHGCEYCYAQKIAERFGGMEPGMPKHRTGRNHVLYMPLCKETKDGKSLAAPYPFGFDPTFHRHRLVEQINLNADLQEHKVDWVIIGAMTGPGSKGHRPEIKWIEDLAQGAKNAGIPVLMKNSVVPIVGEENMLREFPWTQRQEVRRGR